jgi:hypothetical protein
MSDKLETWAVVELFGHDRIAGFMTEEEIAGAAFVRVDVPEVDGEQAYSKLFGPSAIYAITPVSEDVARAACQRFAVRPLGTWTPSVLRALPAPTIDQPVLADGPGEVGAARPACTCRRGTGGSRQRAGEVGDEELICKACGESFADLGDPICPFCGSDDTEPLD